jgi:hypothetical protein
MGFRWNWRGIENNGIISETIRVKNVGNVAAVRATIDARTNESELGT